MLYTVSEKDLLTTMVEVLKVNGNNTIANALSMSKLVYEPQWEFTKVVPN